MKTLTPLRDLQCTGSKTNNGYDRIKNVVLLHHIDQSDGAKKYIVLKSEAVRVEYSPHCCGTPFDWFNFYTKKRPNVNKRIEDLMNQLLQDEAVKQKMLTGFRFTIHTRVEKRTPDMNNIIEEDVRGDYLLLDGFSYYIAELRLDWSAPRSRCLPFNH